MNMTTPPRALVPTTKQEDNAAQLRKDGLLLKEISGLMGISVARVSQLLLAYCDKTGDQEIKKRPPKKDWIERKEVRRIRQRQNVARYATRYPERVKQRRKKWESVNREKRREYNRKWRATNKEQAEATYQAWFSHPKSRLSTLILNRIAESARRGIRCDETALRELLESPATVCAFCGVQLNYTARSGKLQDGPSIDRVDTRYGYINGNIAVLCNKHNQMKGSSTADEHRRFADFIDAYSARLDGFREGDS